MKGNLPNLCYSTLDTTGELIIIKFGESGYYKVDYSSDDAAMNRQIADDKNKSMKISKAQEQAMVAGSMFGWNVPGADPSLYENE